MYHIGISQISEYCMKAQRHLNAGGMIGAIAKSKARRCQRAGMHSGASSGFQPNQGKYTKF